LGIDVVWPTGDQFDMLLEAMPGDNVRTQSYYQRQELTLIGGGMPTASSESGDRIDEKGSGWLGPYLGRTTSRVVNPVFFSPHVSMTRNYPPGVAITGAPGGGKSFLAFTLAHQMAMQGVWTIYIDPKADAKPMGELKGLGSPRVFDLRDGNDGMLDPFSLGANKGESTLLALETMRLLLGGSVSEEREEALLNAIEVVAQQPDPSLTKVVDVLVANTASAGARNLGAVLRTIRELPFARLCFAATGGAALRPEDGLTVVTLLGLDLPSAMTKSEDYSYENRLAVSVMYLLTRYARQLMLNMDKSHPKAICIDEAWAITSTPQGAKLIPEIARMGRSHNTALVLVSQNAGDLMAEAVTNSISTKFAFRSSIPQEIDNVMDLMGLSRDQGYQGAVRDLRNGECLMQDVDGRVSRVYIDAWNKDLFDTFNTNPETRGKSAAERKEE
jgi:type IV secretory pathway VirB4 component